MSQAVLTQRTRSGATGGDLVSYFEYIVDLRMCVQGSLVLGAATSATEALQQVIPGEWV